MSDEPLILTVAPNGAYKSTADYARRAGGDDSGLPRCRRGYA